MADTKISDLTAVTEPIGDSEILPIIQSATSKKVTMAQLRRALGLYKKVLTSQYSNATTTGTEVTGLELASLPAGTYYFQYALITRSSVTTTGLKFGVNFTGTTTKVVANLRFHSTGTTATTGVADDIAAGATQVGQTVEGFSVRSLSTTAPNIGPYAGVATTGADILNIIEGVIVVSTSGNLELWCGSETANSITLETGSNVIVSRVD